MPDRNEGGHNWDSCLRKCVITLPQAVGTQTATTYIVNVAAHHANGTVRHAGTHHAGQAGSHPAASDQFLSLLSAVEGEASSPNQTQKPGPSLNSPQEKDASWDAARDKTEDRTGRHSTEDPQRTNNPILPVAVPVVKPNVLPMLLALPHFNGSAGGGPATQKAPASLHVGNPLLAVKKPEGAPSGSTLAFSMKLTKSSETKPGQPPSGPGVADGMEAALKADRTSKTADGSGASFQGTIEDTVQDQSASPASEAIAAKPEAVTLAKEIEPAGAPEEAPSTARTLGDVAAVRQTVETTGSVSVAAASGKKAEAAQAAQAVAPEPQPAASRPAREVSVRIGDGKEESVDVRLVERAGTVHVAVRSRDVDLTDRLRADLGDLTNSLKREGFETDTWTPPPTLNSAPGSGNPSRQDSPADQRGSQGSGQPDQQEQQQQQGQPRPHWVEEFKRGH